MITKLVDIWSVDDPAIIEAAEMIKNGCLVGLPTETVYGLGANALDESAVKKIFAAKGRPQDNPLIIHVADVCDIEKYTRDLSAEAMVLIASVCPAPLTVVLKKKPIIPDIVSAGLDTVAIRVPSHEIMRAIIRKSGVPIAAPSANISGKPSPTTAEHVAFDMNGKIDMIVNSGACSVGLESTVVDLSGEIPCILRPGKIGICELRKYLPNIIVDPHVTDITVENSAVRSPGMKYRHYAPNAEMFAIEGSLSMTTAKICELIVQHKSSGKLVGVLAQGDELLGCDADFVLSGGNNLEEYGASLFANLRKFDELGTQIVLAQFCPLGDISLAIKNRLYRAAANKIIRV